MTKQIEDHIAVLHARLDQLRAVVKHDKSKSRSKKLIKAYKALMDRVFHLDCEVVSEINRSIDAGQ